MTCKHVPYPPRPGMPARTDCLKCGRPIPTPAAPVDDRLPRDRFFERDFFTSAAHRAGHAGRGIALLEFADSRMWPGGWRRGVNWLTQAREELPDAVSYLGQDVRALGDRDDPDAVEDRRDLLEAAAAIVVAFDRVERVRARRLASGRHR